MQLTLKNLDGAAKSYLGGAVTISASVGATTVLPRELNVIITQDATFLNDITAQTTSLVLTGTTSELVGPSAIRLIETLAQFSTDPLATMYLYYYARVDIRQTAASAAATTVWAMRNPVASTQNVVVERVNLNATFDAGTPIGGKLLRYGLYRFSAATPTGGTAVTPSRGSTLIAASALDVRFLDTGLTVSGVTFESDPIGVISCPAVQGSSVPYVREITPMKLAPGEGLAIQLLDVAATVGQGLCGEIGWSLR